MSTKFTGFFECQNSLSIVELAISNKLLQFQRCIEAAFRKDSILDKENDELRDVVVAAREWAKSCTALVVNPHVQYQLAIRLINKVNAYEANKAKRGKRKRG